MTMSSGPLITGGELYWASIALASIVSCGAALVARWLLRKRSAPVKHGLLLAGLYATALAPLLLFGALVLGRGWQLHVERRWIQSDTAMPTFVRPTTIEPSSEPIAAPHFAETPKAAQQEERPNVAAPVGLDNTSQVTSSWISRLTEFQVTRQPDGHTIVDQPLLPRLLGLVVFAWWIGTFVGLVRLAWGTRVLRRLKRTLIAPADPRIVATLAACLSGVRLRRRVEIRESAAAPAPLSFGLRHPTIVLPADMAPRLDDEQLRLVIAHEVAHVARHDHRVALVERLTSAGFWWNPLVRAVNRGLSTEREKICDDYAAATPGERRRLAEVLVLIAEWSAAAPLRIGGATALVDDARDDLATRVTRLVENKPRAMRVTLRAALGLAAFAVAVGGVVLFSALRAAPYERFQATPAQTAIINELRPKDFLISEGILGFQVLTTGFHASNADVARLAELGNIDDLSLGGEDLTEDCLASIGRMESLRKLSLSFSFTTAALERVARLPNLEELSITSPSLTDDGLSVLASLPKLGTLLLNGTSVSDAGLRKLAEFPALVSVNINNNRLRIGDDALAGIARCPRLTQLAISSDAITDAGLQSLAGCRSLSSVDLHGTGFTDDGMRAVASLPNLRWLTLQGDRLTGAGLRHLQGAAGLEWLRLQDCPLITNDSLAAVGELTQLFRLSLQSKVLTDAGLAHLKNLTGLWELEIDGPKFTGDGLKYLTACQNITEIRAQGERIDDSIFVPLNEFSKLRRIVVGAGQPTNRLSGVTNAGLAKLKSPSLQIAMFARTAITNDGLMALDALPNLSIAHFPFSSDVNPPIWTRGTQRVNRPPRHGVPGVRGATPRLPPLGDAQIVANDALIAELKKTFGPQSVQTTGTRNNEPSLQIDLKGPLVTDELIGRVTDLRNVYVCNISGPNLTDAGVVRLKDLEGVESIRIGGEQLTDACLLSLAACHDMKLLGLNAPHVTDAGLAALVALPKVTTLQLHLPAVTDAGLVHLAAMPQLEDVSLDTKQFTDDGVRNLARSKSLKRINFLSLELTDQSLAAIASMEKLKSVQFFSKKLTDDGLLALRSAQNLEAVFLYSPMITDSGMAVFAELPRLQTVALHDAPITDEGLSGLQKCSELTSLHLNNCRVAGSGLRYLADCQKLEHLSLTGRTLNDSLFDYLGLFPKLRNLTVGGVADMSPDEGLTDEGLKKIVAAKGLAYLYFDYTRFTDDGLAPLLQLPKLADVFVRYSPGVTGAGIARLKQAMPRLQAGQYSN